MRRALQFLYAASGVLAAFFMVLMATLVVVQIGARRGSAAMSVRVR